MVSGDDELLAVAAGGVIGTPAARFELDADAVAVGRLAGRVETLSWMQDEIQLSLREWAARDKFADLRAMEELLARVQDSLRAVQDGTGDWAGLVRTELEAGEPGPSASGGPPNDEDVD